MADAKKCDRCGAFYDTHIVPSKGAIKSGRLSKLRTYSINDCCDQVFDLCNNCWVDFEEFMNVSKKGE